MKLYLFSLCLTVVLVTRSKGASIVTADTVGLSQDDVLDKTWTSIFGCFQKDELTSCLQKRAFRALEDWLPDLDSSNDIPKSERKTNEIKEVDVDIEGKLKEMPPMVRSLIDRLGDIIASGIVHFYPDKNVGVESASPEDEDRMAKSTDSDSVQSARGHKKKVKKAIKKIVIRFLIFLYVLQQTSKLFLQGAQTFIFFKFMVIAGIYVLTNAFKVFHLIKYYEHKDHSKVVYVDKHLDDHHFPGDVDYDHSGHHDPIWGRSTSVTKSNYPADKPSAQQLAYFKQIPQFYAN